MTFKEKILETIINHHLIQHLCTEGEKNITLYSYGNTHNDITGGFSFIGYAGTSYEMQKDHVYLYGLSVSGDGNAGYCYFRTNELIDITPYSTLKVTMKPSVTHNYAYCGIGTTNNGSAFIAYHDTTAHWQAYHSQTELTTYEYDISALTGKSYIFVAIGQGHCSAPPAEAWIYEIKLET